MSSATATANPRSSAPSPNEERSTGRFQKATRQQLRLRMVIDGPTGSGKTYTALAFAAYLAERYKTKIAFIDTESGSARKYVNEKDNWQFDVLELKSFSPSKYTEAIDEAGRLGYGIVVVDSLSHAWEGKDGALETVSKAGGNSYTAWKDVTPMHQRMIESIKNSPAHVICTMRSKMEHILQPDANGKQVPVKIGLAPIQRSGMEYEFDVCGSMDLNHIMSITKTRCSSIDAAIASKPDGGFLDPVIRWLETGERVEIKPPAGKLREDQVADIIRVCGEMGLSIPAAEKQLPGLFGCTKLAELNENQAWSWFQALEGQKRIYDQKAAAAKLKAEKAAGQAATATANGTNGHAATNGQINPAEGRMTQAPATAPLNAAVEIPSTPGMILDEQKAAIGAAKKRLMELGLADQQYKAALAKRGVESALQFTTEAAAEFIDALNKKAASMAPKPPANVVTDANGKPIPF